MAKCFGRVTVKNTKNIQFCEVDFDEEDIMKFNEVSEHYKMFDVLGDSNCGPYAYLLGKLNKLPNNAQGLREWNSLHAELSNAKRFKAKVVNFRVKLSEALTNQIFEANKHQNFFENGLCMISPDDGFKQVMASVYADDASYSQMMVW